MWKGEVSDPAQRKTRCWGALHGTDFTDGYDYRCLEEKYILNEGRKILLGSLGKRFDQ